MTKSLIAALYKNAKFNREAATLSTSADNFNHTLIAKAFEAVATTIENEMYQLPSFVKAPDLTSTTTVTPPTTAVTEFYGLNFSNYFVGNINIGNKSGIIYSPHFDFVAEKSEALTSIKPYMVWGDGTESYGAGDGGTIRIRIYEDTGSGDIDFTATVVAEATHDPQLDFSTQLHGWRSPGTARGGYPVLSFNGFSNALTKGDRYWVHFENIATDPVNRVSINGLGGRVNNSAIEDVYGFDGSSGATDDTGKLRYRYQVVGSSSWTDSTTQNKALYEMNYSGGSYQGFVSLQAYETEYALNKISGNNRIRQNLVTSKELTVEDFMVCVGRVNGTGSLFGEIKDSSGTIVASSSVAASAIQSQPSGTYNNHGFVTFAITPIVLDPTESYTVELSTDASSEYHVYAHQIPANTWGFSPQSSGFDGQYAERFDGSSWLGWRENGSNITYGELPIGLNSTAPLVVT